MVDYKEIARAIKLILIANILFFVNFNLTINMGLLNLCFDIIPDFVGYILIIKSLKILMTYDKTAKIVLPFGYVMMALSIFSINAPFTQDMFYTLNAFYVMNFIGLITVPINIYLTYQVYTIIANLCNKIDEATGNCVKKFRNFKIIVTVSNQIILSSYYFYYFINPSNTYVSTIIPIVIIVINLIALIYFFIASLSAYWLFNNYEPVQIDQSAA
ncbi:MAG: hypothetical protein R3Y27_02855 [Clostridia bacterium]